MFLKYSEVLNSLDSGATTKITINNKKFNKADFEEQIMMKWRGDGLDEYRDEYNRIILEKAIGSDAIIQEKYITISVNKKNIEEARNYFSRVGTDLVSKFSNLGSACRELDAKEKLRIFHDFFRAGEETDYYFDIADKAKKGHTYLLFVLFQHGF